MSVHYQCDGCRERIPDDSVRVSIKVSSPQFGGHLTYCRDCAIDVGKALGKELVNPDVPPIAEAESS